MFGFDNFAREYYRKLSNLFSLANAIFNHQTIAQCDHAPGIFDDTRVVSGENKRHASLFVKFSHDFHDLFAVDRVEVGGRLVGQDQGRFGGQGAGDGHTLLLAAAHLIGAVIGAIGKINRIEQFHDTIVALFGSMSIQQERHFNVFVGTQGGDQRKKLENKADVAFGAYRRAGCD